MIQNALETITQATETVENIQKQLRFRSAASGTCTHPSCRFHSTTHFARRFTPRSPAHAHSCFAVAEAFASPAHLRLCLACRRGHHTADLAATHSASRDTLAHPDPRLPVRPRDDCHVLLPDLARQALLREAAPLSPRCRSPVHQTLSRVAEASASWHTSQCSCFPTVASQRRGAGARRTRHWQHPIQITHPHCSLASLAPVRHKRDCVPVPRVPCAHQASPAFRRAVHL